MSTSLAVDGGRDGYLADDENGPIERPVIVLDAETLEVVDFDWVPRDRSDKPRRPRAKATVRAQS